MRWIGMRLVRSAALRQRRGLASAAVCTAIGERLVYQDWTVAPARKGEVKIKVAAAGVNFADLLKTRGQYQEKADPPFVPGNEVAGEVCEIGDGVRGLAIGDRVICLNRGGAYATECVADARTCVKLPADKPALDLCEAAALLVNYGTAHLALTSRGELQSGESVMVTAASVEPPRWSWPTSSGVDDRHRQPARGDLSSHVAKAPMPASMRVGRQSLPHGAQGSQARMVWMWWWTWWVELLERNCAHSAGMAGRWS